MRRSGESSSRAGFELLMWIKIRRPTPRSRRRRSCRPRRSCLYAPCAGRSCCRPEADHFVVAPQGPVEKRRARCPRGGGGARPVIAAQPGMKKNDFSVAVSMISIPTASPSSLSPGSGRPSRDRAAPCRVRQTRRRQGRGVGRSGELRSLVQRQFHAPHEIRREHIKNRICGDHPRTREGA